LFPADSSGPKSEKERDLLVQSLAAALVESLKELPKQAHDKAFIEEYKAHLINPEDVPEGALDR
jgi:hypothetical protein